MAAFGVSKDERVRAFPAGAEAPPSAADESAGAATLAFLEGGGAAAANP